MRRKLLILILNRFFFIPERLNTALDPAQAADVAAVVLHEGLANVCLITPAMTLTRAKIDMPIPRKRKGFTSQHEKGLEKFYEAVSVAFMRHVNLNVGFS